MSVILTFDIHQTRQQSPKSHWLPEACLSSLDMLQVLATADLVIKTHTMLRLSAGSASRSVLRAFGHCMFFDPDKMSHFKILQHSCVHVASTMSILKNFMVRQQGSDIEGPMHLQTKTIEEEALEGEEDGADALDFSESGEDADPDQEDESGNPPPHAYT